MWLSGLRLENFRNHTRTEVSLSPGVTTFLGANGQGKTNLVEALVYLATGGSHRTASDDVLVQHGYPKSRIDARVHADNRSVRLGLTLLARGANKASVNDGPASLGDLTSWIHVVAFSPEDVAIIRHDPSLRRRFIDQLVMSTTPRFHGIFADYEKVVRQRNALLKSLRQHSTSPDDGHTLAVWNEKLVGLSADITHARLATIKRFREHFISAYRTIRDGHEVEISLALPDVFETAGASLTVPDLSSGYQLELERRHREERERGVTLIGPHRDDLSVSLNALPARTHSSQGEAWSLALALKLGTATLHREDSTSGDPIIVLDDVFSELDHTRRHALARAVASSEQVLITAAVEEDIPDVLQGQRKYVSRGVVTDG